MNQKTKKLSVIVCALFLLGVSVFAYFQHRTLPRKNNSISNAEVGDNQAASPIAETYSSGIQSAPTSEAIKPIVLGTSEKGSLIKIPELNITFNIPGLLEDLEYSVNQETLLDGARVTQVYISTTHITAFDEKCSGALGALTKGSGQYPKGEPNTNNLYGSLIKQFPEFFISFAHPQSACTTNQEINAQVSADYQALLSSIKVVAQTE